MQKNKNIQLAPKRNGKIKEGGTLYINYMSRIIDGSDVWESCYRTSDGDYGGMNRETKFTMWSMS